MFYLMDWGWIVTAGYVNDPAFIRNGKYWNEAPSDIRLPDHFHNHDKAWLISIFHKVETKMHGVEYQPARIDITGAVRERWMMLYAKTYANTLDASEGIHAENIARRVANNELRERVKNTENRLVMPYILA